MGPEVNTTAQSVALVTMTTPSHSHTAEGQQSNTRSLIALIIDVYSHTNGKGPLVPASGPCATGMRHRRCLYAASISSLTSHACHHMLLAALISLVAFANRLAMLASVSVPAVGPPARRNARSEFNSHFVEVDTTLRLYPRACSAQTLSAQSI